MIVKETHPNPLLIEGEEEKKLIIILIYMKGEEEKKLIIILIYMKGEEEKKLIIILIYMKEEEEKETSSKKIVQKKNHPSLKRGCRRNITPSKKRGYGGVYIKTN